MRQDALEYVARVRDAYDCELVRSADRMRALGAAVGAVIAGHPRLDPFEALVAAIAVADRHLAPPWPRLHGLPLPDAGTLRPASLRAVPHR